MNVVMTGASGLIGTALTAALQAAGHDVVALVRRPPRGEHEAQWDPSGEVDPNAVERADAVVHLAGEPIGGRRWSAEQKRRIRDSRVDGTTTIANAIAAATSKPSVLVSASAIGYYGDRGDETLTEKSPPGDSFLAEVTVAWEQAAEPARQAGVRVVHPRTGIVLDPTGGALEQLLLPFKLGLGGPIGKGDQYWSWITLEDEVRALMHLLTTDVEGPVNLTAPEPVTQRHFARALGAALGRPAVIPLPRFALKIALGEMAEPLTLDSARVLPQVLATAGFDFRETAIESALGTVLSRD